MINDTSWCAILNAAFDGLEGKLVYFQQRSIMRAATQLGVCLRRQNGKRFGFGIGTVYVFGNLPTGGVCIFNKMRRDIEKPLNGKWGW